VVDPHRSGPLGGDRRVVALRWGFVRRKQWCGVPARMTRGPRRVCVWAAVPRYEGSGTKACRSPVIAYHAPVRHRRAVCDGEVGPGTRPPGRRSPPPEARVRWRSAPSSVGPTRPVRPRIRRSGDAPPGTAGTGRVVRLGACPRRTSHGRVGAERDQWLEHRRRTPLAPAATDHRAGSTGPRTRPGRRPGSANGS
jgi:hypothetical protein